MREILFIADGCTLPGYVARSVGLHPALRFEYRPATIAERAQLLDGSAQYRDQEPPGLLAAALVAGKLVSWELPESRELPPAICAASVLSLQPELFMKVYRIVLGFAASDLDPAWPSETTDEVVHDAAEAVATGSIPGAVGQERREKN